MEDFSDFITFHVMGHEVNVLSIEADGGISTVVEINGEEHNAIYGAKYCYFGDNKPDIYTAISAWEIVFNRKLKDWEVEQNIQANS